MQRGVSVRRLRWRWSYNRHVLTVVLLVCGGLVCWRLIEPPTHVIERTAPAAKLDVGAQHLAQDYAAAFLSFDGADPDRRIAALDALTGQRGTDDGGLSASTGSRRALSSTVVQAQPDSAGLGTRFVVAVDSDSSPRLYLAVTVGRDKAGALRIVGSPALVGPPLTAGAIQTPSGPPVQDNGLRTVATRALGNYLNGRPGDLAADLAPTAIVSPPSVALRLRRVSEVRTVQGVPGGVLVDADVTGPQGEVMQLTYELGLEQIAGRWVVTGIQVDPAGA